MAQLSPSTKRAVVSFLRRDLHKLEAQLSRASAESRIKLTQGAHNTIGLHMADCTSNAPSITLSITIPSIKKRIEKMKGTILRVEETDEYGGCEECGNEIPIARLQLVPFARECTSCKNEKDALKKNEGRRGDLVYI